jgi:hypothetical protein
MNAADIENIAEAAAEKAVAKMLFSLGIDTSTPEAILQERKDKEHVRSTREACDSIKRQSLKTIITAAGTVIISLLGYVVLMFQRGGH